MGEAKRRGSYEERRKNSIENGSKHPKSKHITRSMITKISMDAALKSLFTMSGIPE